MMVTIALSFIVGAEAFAQTSGAASADSAPNVRVKNPKGYDKRWLITGNPGTDPTINFVGTTDNQPLEIHVDGARVMRFEPVILRGNSTNDSAPNVVGGDASNNIATGAQGSTIGGGGTTLHIALPNSAEA